jgi:hypothetical protein
VRTTCLVSSSLRQHLPIVAKISQLVALALFLYASSAHAQVPQRKSAVDLTPTEVMSLRRGVAKMMARNSAPHGSDDYRRSWIYWANMHQHFGDDCEGPIVGSGMTGVRTFTASNADETATWCKCEHGTNQFLTWHRMYLWYFERVLQEAAGDTSLRLPYWDYETGPVLPAAFRDATYADEQGHTVPNPLRVEARQPGLNNGTASLSAGVTSTTQAIKATRYNQFSSALENTPHGAVHCAIVTGGCPNGLMGSVPVAALDSIFYAHHTNIDRLYECWVHVDESKRLPNDTTQLDAKFTFVDADGQPHERRVGDMLTTTQLGYSYAKGGGCPLPTAAVAVAQAGPAAEQPAVTTASEQVLASVGPTRLGANSTTVALPIPTEHRAALALELAAPTPTRIYATIEGLQYDQAPGGLYDVFLQGADSKRAHIGVINFFGLAPSQAAGGGVHAQHLRTRGNFRFDITEALKQLGQTADAPVSLVFQATSGLNGSPEAAAPKMNTEANVRFDKVQVVKSP